MPAGCEDAATSDLHVAQRTRAVPARPAQPSPAQPSTPHLTWPHAAAGAAWTNTCGCWLTASTRRRLRASCAATPCPWAGTGGEWRLPGRGRAAASGLRRLARPAWRAAAASGRLRPAPAPMLLCCCPPALLAFVAAPLPLRLLLLPTCPAGGVAAIAEHSVTSGSHHPALFSPINPPQPLRRRLQPALGPPARLSRCPAARHYAPQAV